LTLLCQHFVDLPVGKRVMGVAKKSKKSKKSKKDKKKGKKGKK
jgi:hypothetical protein